MSVPAAYAAVVLIWATTPLALFWSGESYHPILAALLRMLIAALMGTGLVYLLGMRLSWRKEVLPSYFAACLGIFGGMSATYLAVQSVPSGLVSVFYGLSPLLSAILAAIISPGSQRFGGARVLACLVSAGGLWVIFADNAELSDTQTWGLLMLTTAVVLFSLSGVLVKKVSAELHPLPQTVASLWVSLPGFVLLWWLMGAELPAEVALDRSSWSILYLALFGSLLGFVSYYYVLQKLPASTVALVTLITPVFALLLGNWLNGETLTAELIKGSTMVLLGLALFSFDRKISAFVTRLNPIKFSRS